MIITAEWVLTDHFVLQNNLESNNNTVVIRQSLHLFRTT